MEEQVGLSHEDKILLLEILFNQNYALELLRCELVDIENGDKLVTSEAYMRLLHLYEKLEDLYNLKST